MTNPEAAPMTMTPEHLRAAAERLAQARITAAAAAEQVTALQETFRTTNSMAFSLAASTAAAEEVAEAELRGLAEAHYKATGRKDVCPGVSVILRTDIKVDATAGLKWAQDRNFPELLVPVSLNLIAAKKMATVMELPFVTKTEVPSTRIASDLAAALTTPEIVEGAAAGGVA